MHFVPSLSLSVDHLFFVSLPWDLPRVMAMMTPIIITSTAMNATMRMRGFSGGWDMWKAETGDGKATTSSEVGTNHHPTRVNIWSRRTSGNSYFHPSFAALAYTPPSHP